MEIDFVEQLLVDLKALLARTPSATIGILGCTGAAYDVRAYLRTIGFADRIPIYYSGGQVGNDFRPIAALQADQPKIIVVASDESKELLLEAAAPYLSSSTDIVIAGHSHWRFTNEIFEATLVETLVPSLANGYPYTLVHIFQCLENASRRGLEGVVAEFGMFKGGTTMAIAEFIKRLGRSWKVIGFDTFEGFPPRRSALDLYAHPGCIFHNEAAVRAYLSNHNVEIVAGDIVTTAARLASEQVVLAFVDTDNYTPATAVLDVIQDRVVVGGAIVFDHFTGRNRFRYTLGERIAAKRLLADRRYFHLHDTGVFFRQV